MAGTSSASDTTGETQWWKWWIRFVVIPILVVTITAFVSFRAGSQRQIAIKGTTSNFDSGGWGTLYFDDESLKGIAQWVQTTSLKPGASPEDHFKLARAYHQLGDFGNAASEYLKAQGVPESKYLHARTLLSLRKPSEAQTVLESVLKSDLDVKVTYYLGVCLMQEHKYEPARQCFQSIVSQRPEALGAWHNIGMCNLHLKDYESAIYALNIVNERNPVFARAAFQK